MIIERKDKEKIKKILWSSFQPMHEHLGFDKAISIHQITKNILKGVNLTKGHRKTCPYFLELFTSYLSNTIHLTILNPKNKKWYLRGLLCETIQESKRKRVGHYFFPKNEDEYNRIKRLAKAQLTAGEIKFQLRVVNGGKEHLTQLGYYQKDNKAIT